MDVLEHDATTGETIIRVATADEIAQREADIAAAQAQVDTLAAQQAAKEAARAKLAALGLTDDEVAALIP